MVGIVIRPPHQRVEPGSQRAEGTDRLNLHNAAVHLLRIPVRLIHLGLRLGFRTGRPSGVVRALSLPRSLPFRRARELHHLG